MQAQNLVHRAFIYEVFPTAEQKAMLDRTFGCCRFVYNRALAELNAAYEAEKDRDKADKTPFSKMFSEVTKAFSPLSKTEEFGWLRDVYTACWHNACANLKDAFDKFFKKNSKRPRFKKKIARQNLTVMIGNSKNGNFEYKDNFIRVPAKLGGALKIGKGRAISGKAKKLTISKTPSGRYFASIACENSPISVFEKTGKEVGLDTGIKSLVVLSDGQSFDGPKPLKNNLRKLKYLQRQLSKKDEFYKAGCRKQKSSLGENYVKPQRSKRREKACLKLAKMHERIGFVRETYLHQITTKIVKNHDVICVEDLAVKNLMRNHKLARALSDNAIGKFYQFLEYKAGWHGREYQKIGRFFPSSKTCGACGEIKQDLKLSDREWTCKSCGTKHDRDVNAAKNILKEGLSILNRSSGGAVVVTDVKGKRGEAPEPSVLKKTDKRRVKKVAQKATKSREKILSKKGGSNDKDLCVNTLPDENKG